jgi:ribosomal protein S27AE
MKQCIKCGDLQPLGSFYKHPQMADGHLNKCKDCAKKDVGANYRNNFKHYQQYDQTRAQLPHRVKLREEYAQTIQGKQAKGRAQKTWIIRNPKKREVHIVTGNAIRDGRLTKKPCEICGSTKVYAHHDDYSKPLSVRWLCPRHHQEHHARKKLCNTNHLK